MLSQQALQLSELLTSRLGRRPVVHDLENVPSLLDGVVVRLVRDVDVLVIIDVVEPVARSTSHGASGRPPTWGVFAVVWGASHA